MDGNLTESNYLSSLKALFEEFGDKQRLQPMYEWSVTIAKSVDGFEEFSQWFFFSEVGRVLTNRPNIGLGFKFTDEQYGRFTQLSFYGDFKRDNDDKEADYCCVLECGEDALKAATILYDILTKVYLLSELPTFNIRRISTCQDKEALSCYFKHHQPMMFCFDLPTTTDMCRIKEQYQKVANCMSKYGFGKVEIDEARRFVKGYYQPTEEPKGLFASIKYGGQLGDTEAELIHLLDLCYQSFK